MSSFRSKGRERRLHEELEGGRRGRWRGKPVRELLASLTTEILSCTTKLRRREQLLLATTSCWEATQRKLFKSSCKHQVRSAGYIEAIFSFCHEVLPPIDLQTCRPKPSLPDAPITVILLLITELRRENAHPILRPTSAWPEIPKTKWSGIAVAHILPIHTGQLAGHLIAHIVCYNYGQY